MVSAGQPKSILYCTTTLEDDQVRQPDLLSKQCLRASAPKIPISTSRLSVRTHNAAQAPRAKILPPFNDPTASHQKRVCLLDIPASRRPQVSSPESTQHHHHIRGNRCSTLGAIR